MKNKKIKDRRPQALKDRHMPNNFDISLKAYGGGGTAKSLNPIPKKLKSQPMKGFEVQYKNIIDYIVRITYHIWEDKNIGYIYDTYSNDCRVWDEFGLQSGSEKIVADTVHTNNAFPDIRLFADEVIWAGDDNASFHTSHRTIITGTNTGYSKFSEPTGKPVRLFCIANCVAKNNEIYYENVVYDTAALIKQLGLNVNQVAKDIANKGEIGPFAPDFKNSKPKRKTGKAKPISFEIPEKVSNVREFVHSIFNTIWNRRNFSAIDHVYSDNIVFEGSTGRLFKGKKQLRSFIISIVASFPDLALSIEDIYWMGNEQDGYLVSIRWGAIGAHKGNGYYGAPTDKECYIWGITQWQIENNKIIKEWTAFNEFGILMQLLGDK
jgi:predicted ester cyclase